jgi:hypothetical protein
LEWPHMPLFGGGGVMLKVWSFEVHNDNGRAL